MEAIFNRRSIRKYEDRPIEKEKIEKLLRAAMQAPSAANQQPWEFLVIEDKEILKKLSEVSPYSKMVRTSAVTFVLLSRKDGLLAPGCVPQDMGAASENLLLQAVELGLGAVWLGVASIDERMSYIKDLFNLPDNIEAFALIPVGYPDGQQNKFVDRFDKARVHYESYK
ncbi:nitroreductase family protein [Clostridium estertheticum]|uniref:nitroreductase family protein n=1 Tax=Clostridium estertheticum TaxID=238834 RepID=UPI001C0C210B|nr:nitroreductase family protein [Clostridium estertheticum]MBU3170489.1 nitroreductase family protein [Clostridium estertheticum]MBW9172633.1 nitroreductase family protein [Clostridium estertheticum]WLC73623.1 nitroreductase family protein [Clostridium estertheticum]